MDAGHIGCDLAAGYYADAAHVPCDLGSDVNNPAPPEPEPEPPYRGIRAAVALPFSVSRTGNQRRTLDIAWPTGELRAATLDAAWSANDEPEARTELDAPWGQPDLVRAGVMLAWQPRTAPPARVGVELDWRIPPILRGAVIAAWCPDTSRVRRELDIPWPLGQLRRPAVTLPWGADTTRLRATLDIPWPLGVLRRAAVRLPWGQGDGLEWDPRPPDPLPPDPIPEGRIDGRYVGADLGCPAWAGPYSHIPSNLGIVACYNVRPSRTRTIVVENTVTVIRLPDELPIEVGSGEITRAVDSWAARVSFAPLTADGLAALKPTGDSPRLVRVTVNGYAQDFVIEDWRVDRRYAQQRYTVTGRSRSALLDAPYAPERSRIQSTIATAAGLVDIELTDTGFTCDWDTLDWTVPAGAWAYSELTPIHAVVRIAEAAGAVVQSHRTDAELIVRPRYPASPWEWTTTSPDVTIYDDLVLQISGAVETKPLYNEVFISAEAKGVQGFFKRQGEGGGEYAPQFVHPLISTALVHAEAGRNILSDRGGQTHWTFAEFPLFPAPILPGQIGLVEPLQLALIVEAGGNWMGQVMSTRLAWARDGARLTVWQTAVLERHPQDAN